jgi:hypothetical protein
MQGKESFTVDMDSRAEVRSIFVKPMKLFTCSREYLNACFSTLLFIFSEVKTGVA